MPTPELNDQEFEEFLERCERRAKQEHGMSDEKWITIEAAERGYRMSEELIQSIFVESGVIDDRFAYQVALTAFAYVILRLASSGGLQAILDQMKILDGTLKEENRYPKPCMTTAPGSAEAN